MFRVIRTDPSRGQVRYLTFVPFLPDGRCVLIERPDGPALPAGVVVDGEGYRISTVVRYRELAPEHARRVENGGSR